MESSSDFSGLTQIGQIAVNAHDLKRAITFYRDVLGLTFLFEIPKAAFFDCGGVRLMLSLPEESRFDHPASIIYYRVVDIKSAFRELTNRGARFEAPPRMIARMPRYDLWMAFLHDSEENMLALMSEVGRD